MAQKLKCSFCSKTQDQVARLLAGSSVFICDECVDVRNTYLAKYPPATGTAVTTQTTTVPHVQLTHRWWRRVREWWSAMSPRSRAALQR